MAEEVTTIAVYEPDFDGVTFTSRTHMCGELTGDDVSKQVTICGWLQYQRMNGQFVVLRDAKGTVQVIIDDTKMAEMLSQTSLESVLEVSGVVRNRPTDQHNKNMKTGAIEVKATDVRILNKCSTQLPFHIHDYHQGAREFVVPTHSEGKFYTLPQSPQQFKQLLMVGGLDRYMQIARCYRDETAKPDRQPEFTQVDIEMSFITQEGIKNLIEGLLQYSWPEEFGLLSIPFQRMSYNDALRLYGSDKPDMRFKSLIEPLSDLIDDSCTFAPFQEAARNFPNTSVQAVKFPSVLQHVSNKDIQSLNGIVQLAFPQGNRTFYAIVRVQPDGSWQGSLTRHIGSAVNERINERLGVKPGDVLLFSAGNFVHSHQLLGRMRIEMASLLHSKGFSVYDVENPMKFLWVEDFPLFLPKEDGSEGLESAHHPFTAPHPDDVDLIFTDPQRVRSQHYDLVLNGCEVGGGSIRIHNSQLQRYVLSNVLKENTGPLEHLIEALDFGCPPHGGIALGVDRLMAILCNAATIREVIAFPKSSEGRCLMSKAPAPVTDEDVEYYHLKSQPLKQPSTPV